MPSPIFFLVFAPALVFFLRFLFEFTDCDYNNPISRFISIITRPFIRMIGNHNKRNINISALILSLLSAEIFGLIFLFVFVFSPKNIFSITTILFGICLVLCLYIWIILTIFLFILTIGAVLSWIPQARDYAILFARLSSPITAPFDKIIPPVGMISLSYMAAFFVLYFVIFYGMPYVLKFIMDIFSAIV